MFEAYASLAEVRLRASGHFRRSPSPKRVRTSKKAPYRVHSPEHDAMYFSRVSRRTAAATASRQKGSTRTGEAARGTEGTAGTGGPVTQRVTGVKGVVTGDTSPDVKGVWGAIEVVFRAFRAS